MFEEDKYIGNIHGDGSSMDSSTQRRRRRRYNFFDEEMMGSDDEGGEEDTYAWREPDVNGELGEFLRRVGPDANELRMKYRVKEMEVCSLVVLKLIEITSLVVECIAKL